MKKYIFLFITFFTLFSCENDSICIDPITPYLVIRFKDYEDQSEYKKVQLDSVWADGKELFLENQSIDTLAIPLDLNNDFTLYKFAALIDEDTSKIDAIKFAYSRKDIFVGRSCGFKTNFENFEIESNTNNWIKEIEVLQTIIDNDTIEAITIFH